MAAATAEEAEAARPKEESGPPPEEQTDQTGKAVEAVAAQPAIARKAPLEATAATAPTKERCCPANVDPADVCLCCGVLCVDVGCYTRGFVGCEGTCKCCCLTLACCLQPHRPPLLCTSSTLGCGPLSLGCANPYDLPACSSLCRACTVYEHCAMPLTDGDVSTCALFGVLCDPAFGCCLSYQDLAAFGGRHTACHVHQDEAGTWCCVLCVGSCTACCVAFANSLGLNGFK
mmetsp:Transcript_1106/g.3168  ORF Transcript_1106/g.3168 Transcript_1106/m.3168 type:complete len:231 (+) Transcript_1106:89-781(+)